MQQCPVSPHAAVVLPCPCRFPPASGNQILWIALDILIMRIRFWIKAAMAALVGIHGFYISQENWVSVGVGCPVLLAASLILLAPNPCPREIASVKQRAVGVLRKDALVAAMLPIQWHSTDGKLLGTSAVECVDVLRAIGRSRALVDVNILSFAGTDQGIAAITSL